MIENGVVDFMQQSSRTSQWLILRNLPVNPYLERKYWL